MKKPMRPRSGALTVLALGFLLSAGLRAGEVIAALPGIPDDGFGNSVATTGDSPGAPVEPETSIMELARELREQASSLQFRSEALDAREKELEEVEARLTVRVEQLTALRQELEADFKRAETAAKDDVRHLAQMYQAMKPKQAGRIFDEMDPNFAAGFLGELRPDSASLILSNMAPEKAYAVSIILASRNSELKAGAD